jgi:flagellar export protein FliJ
MRSKDTLMRLQRFRYEEKRRQVSEIEAMIADFLRKQDDLDQQVKMEETRTGIADPSHFNYSLTAKAIRGRRDNLLQSIEDLRDQLAEARGQLEVVAEELHKAELLAEKSSAAGTGTHGAAAAHAPLGARS